MTIFKSEEDSNGNQHGRVSMFRWNLESGTSSQTLWGWGPGRARRRPPPSWWSPRGCVSSGRRARRWGGSWAGASANFRLLENIYKSIIWTMSTWTWTYLFSYVSCLMRTLARMSPRARSGTGGGTPGWGWRQSGRSPSRICENRSGRGAPSPSHTPMFCNTAGWHRLSVLTAHLWSGL